MKHTYFFKTRLLGSAIFLVATFYASHSGYADPSKYPQFAQQKMPEGVKPAFISIDELVKELKIGAKPMIIDVRTPAEFHELHILGAQSAPLNEFKAYLKSIPRNRPIVLY